MLKTFCKQSLQKVFSLGLPLFVNINNNDVDVFYIITSKFN